MLPITYLFGVLARYAVANTVLLAYLANGDVGLGNVDNTADSAKSVKYATSAGSASSATKATQDSSSQTITSTYIKSLSVSGRTITFTRGNNTTGTITTQDTDTTYSVFKAASSSAAGGTGLVPAPAAGAQAQYLRGDGNGQPPLTQYTLTQHLVVISIFQVVVVQDRSYVGLLMVLPFGVVIITRPIALELVRRAD